MWQILDECRASRRTGLLWKGGGCASRRAEAGWIQAALAPHGSWMDPRSSPSSRTHLLLAAPPLLTQRLHKIHPSELNPVLAFFFFFLFFLFLLGASSRRRQGRGGRAFSPRLPHGGAGSDPLVTLSPNSDPGSTLRSPGRRRQRGSAQLCPSSSAA